MIDLRSAAAALGGEVVGHNQILCPGPGHSPRDRSLAVRFIPTGFICHSHADDDWQQCRRHVESRLGLDPWRPSAPPPRAPRVKPAPPTDDEQIRRIKAALDIWSETVSAKGTLAERYLVETRKLALPTTVAIRFHPALRYPLTGKLLPAMVCCMVDVETSEPIGIHRTYLTDDAKKIDKPLSLGRMGIIKIDADELVTSGLAIAEGVETTIAARYIHRPAWCVVAAGRMAHFPVVNGVEHLTIFADNDENKTGELAARECQERWRAAGREVEIYMPPRAGEDIADTISSLRIY